MATCIIRTLPALSGRGYPRGLPTADTSHKTQSTPLAYNCVSSDAATSLANR